MVAVNVKGVNELAAVVPHLLGFQPTESLVVVPLSPGPPVARVDLPKTGSDREEVAEQLLGAYLANTTQGSMLAVLCFTEDLRAAELTSHELAARLREH